MFTYKLPSPSCFIACLFVLVGCASDKTLDVPECPEVALVGKLSEFTLFKPGSPRSPNDIILSGRLDGFEGDCSSLVKKDQLPRIVVNLELTFEISKGPANKQRAGEFKYFVAITDSSAKIIAKEIFTKDIEFKKDISKIKVTQRLEQRIPLVSGKSGKDFKIFTGFQLNSAQLNYNKVKKIY